MITNLRSTVQVFIDMDNTPYGLVSYLSFIRQIQEWMLENIGAEATSIADLVSSRDILGNPTTHWYIEFNARLPGEEKYSRRHTVVTFTDRKKAALFKLTWA